MSEYIYATDGEVVQNMLSDVFEPLQEVVRCRDCKYRYRCLHLVDDGDDDMRRCHATPDGYCAWGDRRTDD